MEKAEKKGIKIHLPTNFITADKFDKDANVCFMFTVTVTDFFLHLSLSPLSPFRLAKQP